MTWRPKKGRNSGNRCGGDRSPYGRERQCDCRRDDYRLVQTPQVFDAELLKAAYEQPYAPHFTDDASVVEALGVSVFLTPGNRENIKITTPFDLKIATADRFMFDLATRDIKYLSGVGPQRASVLNKELGIYSLHDLLYYFPYKYVDRSRIYYIQEIDGTMPIFS